MSFLPSKKMHFLSMKGSFYLENIINGEKKYEGRINTQKCRNMKVSDHLKLFDKEAGFGIICEITSLDVFDSFDEMLKKMGVLKLLTQLKEKNYSSDELLRQGLKIYMNFPGSKRVYIQGAVAIGVKFLKKNLFPKS